MARPSPQASGVESTIQLLSRKFVFGWDFCGLVVSTLRVVEDPLLLVREEFDDNNDEHDLAEDVIVRRQGVARDARGEQKDVSGRSDNPKQDLEGQSVV